MTDKRDVALGFLQTFARGDVAALDPLLHDDLHVTGPFLDTNRKEEYLNALRISPPEPGEIDILSVTEGDDSVAVFYVYRRESAEVAVAQLFRFKETGIQEMRLVFDTGPLASR